MYLLTRMVTWQDISGPFLQMPWTQWAFWREEVFRGRHLVFWFVVLVPLLAGVPRRYRYAGWSIISLAFFTWAFGPVFTVYLICLLGVMYRLSEAFSRECRRTDIHPAAPLTVMVSIVVGSFIGYAAVRRLGPPASSLEWVKDHAGWLLPMGHRGSGRKLLEVLLITPHFCGIAFLTLKLIHYLAEIRRGTVLEKDRSFWRFMSYLTFAPSFMQGPIDRYADFVNQVESCHRRWRAIDPVVGLARIALGVVKKLIVLAYLEGWDADHPGYLRAPFGTMTFKEFYYRHPEQLPYGHLWLGIWMMTLALYLEFSGYCDLAVGMSRMLGYRMTEAFRRPWLSPSLLEFWRRWNITVGLWLKDYVYIPLGGSRSHVYRNYLLTFLVCGVWHVPNGTMAVWGLLLGLTLAVNRMWRELWSDKPGAYRVPVSIRRVAQKARPLWRVLGAVLTLNVFCLLLLVFFKDLAGAGRVMWQIAARPLKVLLF